MNSFTRIGLRSRFLLVLMIGLILPMLSVWGQNATITGKVVDPKGEPLVGVSVLEQGTTNGTVTDMNGRYSIVVQKDSSPLRFSYMGFDNQEIDAFTGQLTSTTQMEDIKHQPVIFATREAYKRCGKDPGRYRPSAEALRRRLMRGIPLYQIDTLVDLINLVSLRTGHSIGGFDADKIQGTHLELGIGKAGEPFEGIGRGVLNIEGLPVYRDSFGGIGTPTSDHERTKMDLETTHILAIVNGYNGKEGLQEAVEMIQTLLRNYTESDGGEIVFFE